MRICSLLPSATEILFELGLEESIVAVTHECDYPPAALTKPRITASRIHTKHLSSSEIDKMVTANINGGPGLYQLDQKLLESLKPDIIVTQELCTVCAVSYTQVTNAVKIMESDTKVISLEPRNIDGIMETILLLGEITDTDARANEIVQNMKNKTAAIKKITQGLKKPTVYCMEWLAPPFAAGHWVPEMVEIAGGIEIIGEKNKPSKKVDWDTIRQADPDYLVLIPCGFNVERTLKEKSVLQEYNSFASLKAVKSGRVFAGDANSFFSRPGPRVVDGIEILLDIIHHEISQRKLDKSISTLVSF